MADSPIDGRGFTIDQLFSGHRFGLDYYQREYVWNRTHVRSLLDDMYQRFRASWSPEHGRTQTSQYEPYFLGSFVYYNDDSDAVTYLVDGQQRVTTLHLVLMHIRRLLAEQEIEADDDLSELDKLIRLSKHGRRTYTIDVDERADLLDSIYKGRPYALPSNPSPTVRNLFTRAHDLDEDFPPPLRGEALLSFLDWVRDRVCLVGIKAHSRDHGWEIFKTMNDRGANLDPVDLLKSFLLTQAVNDRDELNERWRDMLARLTAFQPHTPSDFIAAMLKGKYADTTRTGRGSDGEVIDRAVHEWVHGSAVRLGLTNADTYVRFIREDVCDLADRYATLMAASEKPHSGLEPVFYNASNGIDLQYPAILACTRPEDTASVFKEKARLIAAYMDLFYVRSFVNGHASRAQDLDEHFTELVERLRGCGSTKDIATLLSNEVAQMGDDFTGLVSSKYGYRQDNRKQVRYLLARVTAWVERECDRPDRIAEYLDPQRPYEIEHIWANKPERFQAEAPTRAQFTSLRNRLGALLLLPKSDNASYQADTLAQKIEYYRNQNIIAASMHPEFHRSKFPRFRKLRSNKAHGLDKLFRGYPTDADFGRTAIEGRQDLYCRLCEIVWNPEALGFTVPKRVTAEQRAARRTRANYDVSLSQLILLGELQADQELFGTRNGERYSAILLADGRVRIESGETFTAVSTAAMTVLDRQSANGWTFWHVKRPGGKITLKKIRDEALRSGRLDQAVLR